MKILYVTTIGATMRFFPDLIRELIREGHTVDIATNETSSPIPPVYQELGCRSYSIDCSRSPLNRGNWRAIRQLRELVLRERYDVVHCHTPIAAMCTRLACRRARKQGTRVFYTAHGFHFYKGASLKNWLLFYPVEKLCAHFTDLLITMNQEDFERAKKTMKAKRVTYVPGVGLDVDSFSEGALDRTQKRQSIGLSQEACALLSVGELNDNKNHQVVLRAMALLDRPDVHYVIAGEGANRAHLLALAEELNVSDRVHLLGYRTDIAELCKATDIFCFPSFREGLPVSIMEAMACGMPVVCGNIRGNTDLIDSCGGVLFDPHSVDSCKAALEQILCADRGAMGRHNTEKIKGFDIHAVIEAMKPLYTNE